MISFRIRTFAAAFAVVLLIFGTTAFAVSEQPDPAGVETGILRSLGIENIQVWIDGELTDSAGSTSEWYIIALSQEEEYDFKSYQSALKEFLLTHSVYSATSRMKYALALAATGSDDPYIVQTMRDSIGVQGHMSWVFGLHFYNNGYKIPEFTAEDILREILSHQLPDGGFAVIGDHGDPDVTAMTLQALAPWFDTNEICRAAADRALDYLSSTQLENGGFNGMGKDNAESSAQVLLALSELGIDYRADDRFIKNGNTVFDSLLRFQLEDGSFSHSIGGDFNQSATVQTFYTSIALQLRSVGQGRFYDFIRANPKVIEEWDETDLPMQTGKANSFQQISLEELFPTYKILVIGAIVTAAIALTLFVLIRKKPKRDLCLIWCAAMILISGAILIRIQSVGDHDQENTAKGDKIGIVMISIECGTVNDHPDDLDPALKNGGFIPEDGAILAVTRVDLFEGDSVYDLLDRACRTEHIHLEVMGASESRLGSVYVEGIGHLYETSCGPLSGWMYRVNGEFPIASSSACYPNDGDVIEWVYTCDLGHDVGNFYQGGTK